jgi:hypothetical protein
MPVKNQDVLATAILETLRSPNECDSNGEIANVVDVLASWRELSGVFIRHRPSSNSMPVPGIASLSTRSGLTGGASSFVGKSMSMANGCGLVALRSTG